MMGAKITTMLDFDCVVKYVGGDKEREALMWEEGWNPYIIAYRRFKDR
jgi:hypothetical protein